MGLSNPVVPTDAVTVDTSEIIPQRKTEKKVKTGTESLENFNKNLQDYMQVISKEYYETFKGDLKAEMTTELTEFEQNKLKEYRRDKFLNQFVEEGKYDILKDKMKKQLSEIVRDKFKKKALDKLKHDDRDLFLSELYAFLTDQVKTTIKRMVTLRKEELNVDLVESHEQAINMQKSRIQNLSDED